MGLNMIKLILFSFLWPPNIQIGTTESSSKPGAIIQNFPCMKEKKKIQIVDRWLAVHYDYLDKLETDTSVLESRGLYLTPLPKSHNYNKEYSIHCNLSSDTNSKEVCNGDW